MQLTSSAISPLEFYDHIWFPQPNFQSRGLKYCCKHKFELDVASAGMLLPFIDWSDTARNYVFQFGFDTKQGWLEKGLHDEREVFDFNERAMPHIEIELNGVLRSLN